MSNNRPVASALGGGNPFGASRRPRRPSQLRRGPQTIGWRVQEGSLGAKSTLGQDELMAAVRVNARIKSGQEQVMETQVRFELLAKCGYAARGLVFILVAGLALFSGVSGGSPETKSALSTLLQQPFGRVWVGLIGAGLLGFVAWRLAQSVADADQHGRKMKALVVRAALFGSAITYLGLAACALGQACAIMGESGAGEKGLAGWIMTQPFGPYLAIAVGIGFVVGGSITSLKGLTGKYKRYLKLDTDSLAALICVYGLVARGIVFAVTGVLFVFAGINVDPNQAGNMADALHWVRQLPFGSILNIAIAIGLAAFGVYNLIEARYRIVRSPSLQQLKTSFAGHG
jgi:hypothetical protein